MIDFLLFGAVFAALAALVIGAAAASGIGRDDDDG